MLVFEALVWGRDSRFIGADSTHLWGERWGQGLRLWSAARGWTTTYQVLWLSKPGPNVGDQLARIATQLSADGNHHRFSDIGSAATESQFVSFVRLTVVAMVTVIFLGCGGALAAAALPVYLLLGCALRVCGLSLAAAIGALCLSGTLLYHIKCLVARLLGFRAKQEVVVGGGP